MESKYFLLLKTGQAEIRSYRSLTLEQKLPITPIIEMTRGRKNHAATFTRTGVEYNFGAIRSFIQDEMIEDQLFFIDVTKEDALSSAQTRMLRDPANGYKNWVDFIRATQASKKNCAPIMQINPPSNQSWQNYEAEIHSQFDALAQTSRVIGYRAMPKRDNSFDIDLEALEGRIRNFTDAGGVFSFVLDYDYIRPGTGELHALEASKILDVVFDIAPTAKPVLISTSFPNSVTEVAGEDAGEFSEEEVIFHRTVSRQIHNKFTEVVFGDYGSINPIRNDNITAATGWRPRIDYPFGGERVFYFREKRQSKGKGKEKVYTTTYSHHYRSVANSITQDPRFKSDVNSTDSRSWGVEQIKLASGGRVNGSSPSFWISVRMNIHIQQQLRRLGLYN